MAADGLDGFVWLDEKLELHLLELARAEGEIAWGDFIAKRLADLANAEGHFLARGIDDVLELREDRLSRFRAEIRLVRLRRGRADVSGEHQIERLRFGELSAIFGIERTSVLDLLRGLTQQLGIGESAESIELGGDLAGAFRWLADRQQSGEGIFGSLPRFILRAGPAINDAGLQLDVIGAEALLRHETVAHRIAEGIHMPRGLPDGRVHDDCGIEADDVFAVAGHGAPPRVAQVALQFRAEGAVVPEAVDAPVDFGALENETASFRERNDLFHLRDFFGLAHKGGRKCARPRQLSSRKSGGKGFRVPSFWFLVPLRDRRSQRKTRNQKLETSNHPDRRLIFHRVGACPVYRLPTSP